MLQLVGLVVTLITLLVSDVWCASCVRTYMRMRVRTLKNVPSQQVVGVGIAFVGMRIYLCGMSHKEHNSTFMI